MSGQSVFVSYSHRDEAECKQFLTHLAPLRAQGRLVVWSDHEIAPGQKWADQIDRALADARIAIMLVSPNFLESRFVAEVEIPRLLRASETSGVTVLCLYLDYSVVTEVVFSGVKLTDFQGANSPDRPLSALGPSERVKALRDLALTVLNGVKALDEDSVKPRAGAAPFADSGPQAGPTTTPPPRPIAARTHGLDSYRILRQIASGPNGDVFKCRTPDTDALCVVKRTDARKVNVSAQEQLASLTLPNIAIPTRIWSERDVVYEELPYIGGTRLSEAVPALIGGLRGFPLSTFFSQMGKVLNGLHAAKLVHRDVHPDNIYLMVSPEDPTRPEDDTSERWESAEIGVSTTDRYPGMEKTPSLRRISFVLVDCTFVAQAGASTASVPVMHGWYTPLEQILGSPSAASDYYALGATLYYLITGNELPAHRDRTTDVVDLDPVDDGENQTFAWTVQALLVRDISTRRMQRRVSRSTVASGDAGMLALSDGDFLIGNTFGTHTRVVRRREALEIHTREMVDSKEWLDRHAEDRTSPEAYYRRRYEGNERLHMEHAYWVKTLSSPA